MLGDSAYTPSQYLVPSLKRAANEHLEGEREYFNRTLAKVRMRVEHAIGILKGRFPVLKWIRVLLKSREDMVRILDIVHACAILHNYLINERVPDSWIEQESNDTNEPEFVHGSQSSGETFRSKLLEYLLINNNVSF